MYSIEEGILFFECLELTAILLLSSSEKKPEMSFGNFSSGKKKRSLSVDSARLNQKIIEGENLSYNM